MRNFHKFLIGLNMFTAVASAGGVVASIDAADTATEHRIDNEKSMPAKETTAYPVFNEDNKKDLTSTFQSAAALFSIALLGLSSVALLDAAAASKRQAEEMEELKKNTPKNKHTP